MFDIIKSFFNKKNGSAPQLEITPIAIQADADVSEASACDDYFLNELEVCPYIKVEAREKVLDHLRHKVSLLKTGNKLTLEEKKELGVNPRLSITKEFLEVLTVEGLALSNPKQMLEDIYNKATIEKLRDDSFAKSIKIGIKQYTLEGALSDSCKWCKDSNGKKFGLDIMDKLKENCECKPYSKCYIAPVIKF